MARKKEPKGEIVFTGMALQKGWERVNAERAWWFYTAERFSKRWSLDGQGVPITWDETEYGPEEIREGTGNDVCVAILNNDHEEKLILVVQSDMPTLLILGKRSRTISWEDYAKEGLNTVKKLLPRSRLEAVVINLRIPVKSATQSRRFRPLSPEQVGHPFQGMPATLSERSDAGWFMVTPKPPHPSTVVFVFSSSLLSG